MLTRSLLLSLSVSAPAIALTAQIPVRTGAGSYASEPPTYKSRTADHGGSWATMMQTREIFADETLNGKRRPIPTNDWWTDLLNHRYADALWSYPQMLKPSEEGVTVNYPSYWIDNGTEVKSRSWLRVGGKGYRASAAIAADWHDWDVTMRLPGNKGGEMKVTMAHGIPFSWFEFDGVTPLVTFSATPVFFDSEGNPTGTPAGKNMKSIGIRIGDDLYGHYLPEGTTLNFTDGALRLDGKPAYCVVALLHNPDDIARYARWAYSIPRSTEVSWSYDEPTATLSTQWHVEAENLLNPGEDAPVLQGFLPHAYKHASGILPVFTGISYLTPRGQMRMAEPSADNTFRFSMRFPGIMPHYAAPDEGDDTAHPYSQPRMDSLMKAYASEGAFGADTYWGGKGLIQMAMNMTFALETGNNEAFETSRQRLRQVMEDWLTYTPGEDNFFFAYYPRWGSMLGYEYSYDSDLFNDHHFHYGYMLYAGALLCMNDADFKEKYGDMLRLIAKDFANWDRSDSRFPFLRTLDPWAGHSYAGGLGDGANDNGNGQESSSEAMQGWGGVYLLGVALGDTEMRDAGIFGWLTESNGVAEYWFDRDHIRDDREHNYDYTLYPHPYNTNITSKGIGWWTWFSGDPLWMHSIQWMPVSPCLNYLSQDLDFVKWDYESFESSTAYKWFEEADRDGERLEPLARQSVGNVVLSYLERYNPARAAEIFDTAWDTDMPLAKSIDTGHISYYVIHSHLRWGDPDYSVHASIPTANAYRRTDGSTVYMVYNPEPFEQTVRFYRDGAPLATWKAPVSDRITCFTDAPVATSLRLSAADGNGDTVYIRPGGSARFTATLFDNYGASLQTVAPEYSISGASVSPDGTVTLPASITPGTGFTLTASHDGLDASIRIVAGENPALASGAISPSPAFVETGNTILFSIKGSDQYGNPFETDAAWRVTDADGNTVCTSSDFTAATPGRYRVEATSGTTTLSHEFTVTPPLPNLALGCAAFSSSEENAGCLTSNATDGDTSTRWGSAHTDNEWIYVDLGKDCIVTGTSILWEAAYAASYAIEGASGDTPREWHTLKTVTGISGAGEDRQAVDARCRYIRIRGIKRGTAYGYSLHELRVHGIPADAGDSFATGLYIPLPSLLDEDRTYTLEASLCRLDGSMTPTDAQWNCDGLAEIKGHSFTPRSYGNMTITARADGFTTETRVLVAESIKLHHCEVSPASATILLGDPLTLTVRAYNQFDGLWTGDFASQAVVYSLDGEGNASITGKASFDASTGAFTAREAGNYAVEFADGTRAEIFVKAVSEANLALGKTASASSVHDGNTGAKAVDGDTWSRWESDWSDNHWLMVDLEEPFIVNRVRILWEGAYASRYSVEVSLDGNEWHTVADILSGKGATEEHTFDPVPAQFVRLNCLARATGYGNSVHELEVYGTDRYHTPTAIELPGTNMDGPVDVYSTQGILLRKGVRRSNATEGLLPGLYIVGGKLIINK